MHPGMSQTDTKHRIVNTLRSADAPALSAKSLAGELDVSVRTINNHVNALVADDRVATTQIGNATAYYIPFEDLPTHQKPDHTCRRCGREILEYYDFAKLSAHTYFVRGNSESETADFYVFCRFCYADFISWMEDSSRIGAYPRVHSWDLPAEQLQEVREDPETETAPGSTEYLEPAPTQLLEFIEDAAADAGDRGVPKHDVIKHGVEDGMLEMEAKQALQTLRQAGYLFEPMHGFYKPAK